MKIREIRVSKGISQRTLAKRIGVTQGAVFQWENGLTWPSVPTLLKLADVLQCSTDELLGRKQFPQ